ncbi:MAG: hypothetical protein Q8P08_01725 [bacterium]|nr:hypothetical protein [bacterium]
MQKMKTVIRSEKGMVMVLDEQGEQIPEYQGQYEDVKDKVLRNARPTTQFFDDLMVAPVSREEW